LLPLFLSFKGQLLVFVFGALPFGSYVALHCLISTVKQLNDIALLNKSSQRASLAMWDHTVFVTYHPTQVSTPRLTPARQAGTRLTYPGGMEG